MIQPDFELYLWLSYILALICAIGLIILGAVGAERSQKYSLGDVLYGIVLLVVLVYIGVK